MDFYLKARGGDSLNCSIGGCFNYCSMTSLGVLDPVQIPYQKTAMLCEKITFKLWEEGSSNRKQANDIAQIHGRGHSPEPFGKQQPIPRCGIGLASTQPLNSFSRARWLWNHTFFNLKHEPLQAWGNLLGIAILDLFAEETASCPWGHIRW